MTTGTIIVTILLTLMILTTVIALYTIKRYYDNKEKEISISNSVKYLNIEINDEIFGLLDKLVEREFNDFIKLHPDKFDDSGNAYINEEEYKTFLSTISQRVYKHLTPAIKAKISLVYSFDTEKEQLTIILEKVGVMLAMYRARINSAVIDDTLNEKSTVDII